jgi:malyl-CoA/(S)-citramalyl-CoA lyase
VPIDRKEAAREGLVQIGKSVDFGDTQFWTRVNSLDSPWFLDDLIRLVGEIGDKLDVIMLPKIQGPWDIHFADQLLAQLEAKYGVNKPLMIHAILETALGVANVDDIANASPRMQGMSLGPADLAASRRMKTTRVGGGHPDYVVRTDPDPNDPSAPRPTAQQDLWHYTIGRMVDACVSVGALAFYGPFGDIADLVACEDQFRNAYLMGCVGTWTLHPNQIAIAKRVFSPKPEEVAWAKRVVEAMPDGSGAVMIDGKMQDDATWKQCKVVLNLAQLIASRDAEYKALYGF